MGTLKLQGVMSLPYPINHPPSWYKRWFFSFTITTALIMGVIAHVSLGDVIVTGLVTVIGFLIGFLGYIFCFENSLAPYLRYRHQNGPHRGASLREIRDGMWEAAVIGDTESFRRHYSNAFHFMNTVEDAVDELRLYEDFLYSADRITNLGVAICTTTALNVDIQRQFFSSISEDRISEMDVIRRFWEKASNDLRCEIQYAISTQKWDPLWSIFDKSAFVEFLARRWE